MSASFPKTILVTGARAPVALHWARLLQGAGHEVWLADSLKAPLAAATRLAKGYIRLPSPRFQPEAYAQALESACASRGIGLILPTCEEIFHLAKLAAQCRLSVPLFAPEFDKLEQAHHKFIFIQTCRSLGIQTPQTALLTRAEDLTALPQSPLVFKPVWSRFADQVRICPQAAEIATLHPNKAAPWVAQEYLGGEEISVFALASQGELRALSAYRARARAGQGASIVFEPVEDPTIEDILSRYVSATAWHGQISLDLRRAQNGNLMPIECNPRATSGLHFFTNGGALLQALGRDGPLHRPEMQAPLGSKLALLAYGAKGAVQRPAEFRALWRETTDLHAWPGDHISPLRQIGGLAEILATALRHRISPEAASTYDIEWNGP